MPRIRMAHESLSPVGFGTYTAKGDACRRAVETALEVGYRHIDTADMYENQSAVGEGLRRADVDREEVFVATKLQAEHLAYGDVLERATVCRERLGVDVIDLLYIHWPTGQYEPTDTLPAFDELHDRGVIRHVGLSNFTPAILDEAMDTLDAPVAAHQVECHPFLPQEELRQRAIDDDHTLVAYCPIARGNVGDDRTIRELAETRDLSPAQVSLAWLAGMAGVVPIPKSTTAGHIRENFDAIDVTLDQEARGAIDAIDRRERLVDFPGAPWNE